MDILRKFDRFFNQSKAVSNELSEYCMRLIRNKKGRMPSPIDCELMRKGDEWYARCEDLFREAETLPTLACSVGMCCLTT